MNKAYKQAEWNEYAQAHLSVTTSFQFEVYKNVAHHMKGNVADFGCGTAKITPFLVDQTFVKNYTGIDYSTDMITQAQRLLDHLGSSNFTIKHNKIEDVSDITFDSGLSINSYYSWHNPLSVLSSIYDLLKPNAPFILVTPNKKLNMRKLLQETDKELSFHPHYHHFKNQNMDLAGNEGALFIEMDQLIDQVRTTGFKLISCHQDYFMGGLNFIHLRKS